MDDEYKQNRRATIIEAAHYIGINVESPSQRRAEQVSCTYPGLFHTIFVLLHCRLHIVVLMMRIEQRSKRLMFRERMAMDF